jgi:(4S)-4-hydroxy-5-phosphonooxypentane-2,3-dione isomerase
MLRSSMMRAGGIALTVVASVLFLSGHEAAAQATPPAGPPAAATAPAPSQAAPAAPAAAQPVSDTTPFYVNIVDLEISPSLMSKFMADLSDDVKGTLSEAAVHEIDSNVGQKDPNHVFIFEVYNNSAAWDAHQKTTTYGKFIGLTMMMIKNYNIRPFTSLVLNSSTAAAAAAGPLYVNVEEFDLDPDQYDNFIVAAKVEAAGAVQDPGVREFNIATAKSTKNHVLLFEVYDNAAALEAEMATDRYKTYQAKTKPMIVKSTVTPYTSVSLNAKTP